MTIFLICVILKQTTTIETIQIEVQNPHFPKLSNRVKLFKESEKGVETMCEIMERERMEGRIEGKIERDIDLFQKKSIN